MKYVWILLLCFAALICCSYAGMNYYVTHVIHFIAYTSDRKIEDKYFHEVKVLHPGQGFIYHSHINNYNPECVGEYSLNLKSDKVDYQFPRIITRNVFKEPKTEFDINGFFNIPQDFPPGHYKFHQIAFPRCSGIDIKPYSTELNEEIDIVDGK